MDFPNVIFATSGFDTAYAVTAPEFSAPLPGVNVDYILTQDWQMDFNDFTPLALNTPHPDFADFVLVSEGNKRDIQGGAIRWTRIYGKVPASYTEMSGTITYNFIGFQGYTQTSSTADDPLTGRPRFTHVVAVQITRDFFLVGAGETYSTSEEIPTIPQQEYLLDGTNFFVDFLGDDPPYANQTDPGQAEYEAMVAADLADQSSYSIVVETAAPVRWQGNIFVRETRRIKAL